MINVNWCYTPYTQYYNEKLNTQLSPTFRVSLSRWMKLIVNTLNRTVKLEVKRAKAKEQNEQEFISFIKIPFINPKQRHEIAKLYDRTGVRDKIRLIFTTEKALACQFRPKPVIPSCPVDCIACITAIKGGCCFTKFAVYLIICDVCGQQYIGETERTIRSRITEHTKATTSQVYSHMLLHGNEHLSAFKWRILATHPNTVTRLAIESLNIKQHTNLMNGCAGVTTLPFLLQV